jgi:hypothetical protein
MKMAHVLPPEWLDPVLGDMREVDYHLILSEVFRHDTTKRYEMFYKQRIARGDFVILDNGAYEYGRAVDLNHLIEVANLVQPSEVVLPDDMHSTLCHLDTVTMSVEASFKLRAAGHKRFMAVPHGHNLDNWVWCAQQLMAIPGVQCLGIAEKDAIKLRAGDRAALVDILVSEVIEPEQEVSIHLLGMMEQMDDVEDPFVRSQVRGVDGSKMIVWGMHEEACWPSKVPATYPGRPTHYLEMGLNDLTPDQCVEIRHNIQAWQGFLQSDNQKGLVHNATA